MIRIYGTRLWWLYAAFWTTLAFVGPLPVLLHSPEPYLALVLRHGVPLTWWGGLAIAGYWTAGRFPLIGRGWFGRLQANVAAVIVLVALHCVALHFYLRWIGVIGTDLYLTFVTEFPYGAIIASNLIGTAHAVLFLRGMRERERLAAQSEAELARLRLAEQVIRVNPPVVINALRSVSQLLRESVPRADARLAEVGHMLRVSLAASENKIVPFRADLGALLLYAEMQGIDLRLQRSVHACMNAPTDPWVPALSLILLAEAAVELGAPGGAVSISVRGSPLRGEGFFSIVLKASAAADERPADARPAVLAEYESRIRQIYGSSACLRHGRTRSGRYIAATFPPGEWGDQMIALMP